MPRKRMMHNEILNSLHDRIGGIHLENPRGVRICLLLQKTVWFTLAVPTRFPKPSSGWSPFCNRGVSLYLRASITAGRLGRSG